MTDSAQAKKGGCSKLQHLGQREMLPHNNLVFLNHPCMCPWLLSVVCQFSAQDAAVKVSKGKRHLKRSLEARRGSPQALLLSVSYRPQQEELPIPDLNSRGRTLQIHTVLQLQQEEDFLLCPATVTILNSRSSSGLSFKTTPLKFLLFSIK